MPAEVLRHEAGVMTLHILDGLLPTPNGVVVPFVQGDLSTEIRQPRPQSIVRLNGGVIDAFSHVITGNDEFIAAGVQGTFTYWLEFTTLLTILRAMSNALEETITTNTWVVGAGTFTNAMGTGSQIRNGAGTLVDPILHADPRHMRVHLEGLFTNNIGGSNRGFRLEEVHFESIVPTFNNTESPARVTFRRFGRLIDITAFTAFTDLTPAV